MLEQPGHETEPAALADELPPEPAQPAAPPRPWWRTGVFEIVETLALTVLIFLGIQTFVAQPYKVEQLSMENTLQPDQFVLVDKLTPRWAPYRRGDIVVFDPPDSWSRGGDVPFIKRVIGLPGDRIELHGGKVFVNGGELEEPYLFPGDGLAEPTDPAQDGADSWTLPDGALFVMGDHRQASADSRTFGPIDTGDVIGRAWLRYWPIDTFEVLPAPPYAVLATP